MNQIIKVYKSKIKIIKEMILYIKEKIQSKKFL